jgi:hypothetical protein
MDFMIDNLPLYEQAKKEVYKEYPNHSAYRSGQLVKRYKELGGSYSNKKPKDGLTRWFKEEWKSIGGDYPTYRPTKRVSKDTPLTVDEIDPIQAVEQIKLKQKIKGESNLPPFKGKGVKLGVEVVKYEIDPEAEQVADNLGIKIRPSEKKNKKIDIYDANNQYIMSIGDRRYNDYRSYIKLKGLEYANKRKKLYKIRHNKNRHKLGSASYYADKLLWT